MSGRRELERRRRLAEGVRRTLDSFEAVQGVDQGRQDNRERGSDLAEEKCGIRRPARFDLTHLVIHLVAESLKVVADALVRHAAERKAGPAL